MKYTKDWLLEETAKSTYFEYFGFWGSSSESLKEKSFSNFYIAPMSVVIFDGRKINFKCNEQYFMYRKALEFKDFNTLEEIITKNLKPKEYKDLGRKVSNYNDEVWSELRYQAMLDGLREKYTQNPKLKTYLLSTGKSILVETSPFDEIFGIKLGKYDKFKRPSNLWKNPRNWRGTNYLGFALMELRDELKG